MVTLCITNDPIGSVILNIFNASSSSSMHSMPTFPPIEDILKRHTYFTALTQPPREAPTSSPTPRPPLSRASLLVNERKHLSTPIGKRADDQLVLMLPSGEEHVIAGQSHDNTVQTLQEWLMRAKIDLMHNAGAATEAVRAVVEDIAACLQLGVDALGPVRHFRIAVLDSFGGLHAPPSSLRMPAPHRGALDVDGFGALLADAPPRSVIVMVGAGMSVSAGIPDFRSPTTGLFAQLAAKGLPSPELVTTISFFKDNPWPFYELCDEIWPRGKYKPTYAHRFIKALHDDGKLLRCFTQNIDSLETAAGLPAEAVVPAHGNFDSASVVGTGEDVPVHEVAEAVEAGDAGWTALNTKYGGLVKPDVVFFGEQLPERFNRQAREDFPKCKLLLIFGTSLQVFPFASLVRYVPPGTPRLLCNRERRGENVGLDFDDDESCDVFLQGDCDDGASELARLAAMDVR